MVLFWHDYWVGPEPLKKVCPRLFSISSLPNASIYSFGFWVESRWSRTFSWTRALRPHDKEEFSSLQFILKNVCISIDVNDSFFWCPTKTGEFSVRPTTMELTKTHPIAAYCPINMKRIWRGLIPPRIEAFTWLALLGRINSKARLVSMNVIPMDDANCVFCQAHIECSDHLLLRCGFSREILSWWMDIWGISLVFPNRLYDAFFQWPNPWKTPFLKKVWCAMFSIIIWSIWKEQNSRIFCNKSCSIPQLQDLILTRLSWWIKGWRDPFPYLADEIIRHPLCLDSNISSKLNVASIHLENQVRWSPPRYSSFKWNVDASVNSEQSRSTIDEVLRNSQGIFMCVFSCPIPPIEMNSAEIIAIFRAIQISFRSDHLKVSCLIMKFDSANVVRWCNEDNGGPWNLNFQLNLIRNARKLWLDVSIIHKGRSSNFVANALAKKGLSREDDFVAWL